MKIYVAGKLGTDLERKRLEHIETICAAAGFKTYLPHRDGGIARDIRDASEIFRKDIFEGFEDCSLVVAVLDGLHVGAGTAWEIGYAYGKNIPVIGVKMDEPIEEAFEYLSSILIASVKWVDSLDKLEKALKEFRNKHV